MLKLFYEESIVPLLVGGVCPNSGHQISDRRVGQRWRRRVVDLRPNQALQRFGLRRQRAKKARLASHGQQQGGKVFDIKRMQQVGFVFDIDPEKARLRKFGLHLREACAIVPAHAAPFSAEADDEYRGEQRRGFRIHEDEGAKIVEAHFAVKKEAKPAFEMGIRPTDSEKSRH